MSRFTFRFLIIFIASISILFFSLIGFQKMTQDRMMRENQMGFQPPIEQNADFIAQGPMMPPNPPVPQGKEPPIFIPFILIVGLSSLILFLLLKYIDKNFVKPLIDIETGLKQIQNGEYNKTSFKTDSENEEIKNTFKTLNEMTQGLEEKEQLQANFIQNLAHDLRGPIIAQERAFEILEDEFKEHELLEGLKNNSELYLKMINTIIEAYSNKEIVINKINFNFYKMVNSIYNALTPLANDKNIKLNNEISQDFMLFADYITVNRIIMNLVSNAIENIDNNKEIKIEVQNDNDKTIIVVEDNGNGISNDKIGKIFDKYISSNKSGKKAISGLGLSIVKELVEKNNGSIKLESKEHSFTRFIIELPKGKND